MEVQQPIFCLLNSVSAAEDVAQIQPAHRLQRVSSFPLLPSPSLRCVLGRNLRCSGTLSAVCRALKRHEFLCFLPPLFAFLMLTFHLLFLTVKHLFFLLLVYFPYAVSVGKWDFESCKKKILKGWQSLR